MFPEIYAVHLNSGSAFMDWPRAYHRLGPVCLNKGDLPTDLENFRKFLELDPQNPDAAGIKAAVAAIEKIKN